MYLPSIVPTGGTAIKLILIVALAIVSFVVAGPCQAQAVAAVLPHVGAPFATEAAARAAEHGTVALRLQSAVGMAILIGFTFVLGLFGKNKGKVLWPTVGWGVVLQFLFAWSVLDTGPGAKVFALSNDAIDALLGFSQTGAQFLFGNLVHNNVPVGVPIGDPSMGSLTNGNPAQAANTGAFFAFDVLPTIIFFSALSTLLYHVGIMPRVVAGFAWLMQKTMRTSGAETVSAAANIFLGQTEAPLMVKPYIAGATNSELMAIMVGGFANIASGVLAAYVGMLRGFYPDIGGHLLAASLISAPCSLVVAKLLMPENGKPTTSGTLKMDVEKIDANVVDATARGAVEGLHLTLNVGAVLIVFVAMVTMIDTFVGWGGSKFGHPHLSFEQILGWVATPFAYLMGIPWKDAVLVGPLLGVKTVINEFVAYLQLSQNLAANPNYISPRTFVIIAYALCGFANFGSVAIQIGGIGGMAPERRGDLSRMGITAMFGGALSSLMTACVVGVML